jgi:hypothetical protein
VPSLPGSDIDPYGVQQEVLSHLATDSFSVKDELSMAEYGSAALSPSSDTSVLKYKPSISLNLCFDLEKVSGAVSKEFANSASWYEISLVPFVQFLSWHGISVAHLCASLVMLLKGLYEISVMEDGFDDLNMGLSYLGDGRGRDESFRLAPVVEEWLRTIPLLDCRLLGTWLLPGGRTIVLERARYPWDATCLRFWTQAPDDRYITALLKPQVREEPATRYYGEVFDLEDQECSFDELLIAYDDTKSQVRLQTWAEAQDEWGVAYYAVREADSM